MTTDMTTDGSTPRAALATLADAYWEDFLRAHPEFATSIGDRRFDHLLADKSPDGVARERTALDALARDAVLVDPTAGLSAVDPVTHSALVEAIRGDLALIDAGLDDWSVDPLGGPQVAFNDIAAFQVVRTPDEGRAMVERWRAMGPWVDVAIANLRRSLAEGRASRRVSRSTGSSTSSTTSSVGRSTPGRCSTRSASSMKTGRRPS